MTWFEKIFFSSRWMLVLFAVGLIIGLAVYTLKFSYELYEMIVKMASLTPEMTLIGLLSLVDGAMVANLVIMIAIGSYSIFVKEINSGEVNHAPRFMNHITSSGLKVKMGSSLIGVSSIHLLKKFVETSTGNNEVNWNILSMMLAVHVVFVISTFTLAAMEKFGKEPKNEHA